MAIWNENMHSAYLERDLMTKLDIDFVRQQFPAFSEPSLAGFAHFENAGGSYACAQMIDALHHYYTTTKVQPYYCFEPSIGAGQEMTRARERMGSWLNVAPDEVHFSASTSQNSYVVAQALRDYLQPGDEIIVTNQDHEANIGVWRRLEAQGIVIREWQVNPQTAELEDKGLDALLNEKTRVVAFTHCSNIVGSINPVREWADKIHAVGALAFVDGVSYAGHGLPDVEALGADIYFFSLYKVYGPHLGVMIMRDALNKALPSQGHFFNVGSATSRFTPAGPDHAQIASVNGVIDYFEAIDAHHFSATDKSPKARRVGALLHSSEIEILKPLLNFLKKRTAIRLIGKDTADNRAPTVSFTVHGVDPAVIAEKLAEQNIGIANGNCYAYRLMEALDIPPDQGVVRLSFVHYTSAEEVSRLITALESVI
ncbi:MAG: cysteine desulfurase family protein (TIGR01976 family) [Polaribacter sp.]|jgi:cysteine desulfurase family protein (TIGR01976 family)|tara:strand:- start:13147 stop:14424 length:1278 start_codon:yes stop_codon:yes gene_type:complete